MNNEEIIVKIKQEWGTDASVYLEDALKEALSLKDTDLIKAVTELYIINPSKKEAFFNLAIDKVLELLKVESPSLEKKRLLTRKKTEKDKYEDDDYDPAAGEYHGD